MNRIPLFDALENAQHVLIAGAGGGFDIYCGVPLMLALERAGKRVTLANYAFTNTAAIDGPRLTPNVVEVTAESVAEGEGSGGGAEAVRVAGAEGDETRGPAREQKTQSIKSSPELSYFPERELCRWFRDDLSRSVSVYTFAGVGVAPLTSAYSTLVAELDIDAIVLVDGGTDSLMRGDEAGLGTPSEDATSLAAVHALEEVSNKFLVCVGFGVDAFHGVCHAQFLEAVAAVQRAGGFLGAWSLLPDMEDVAAYLRCVETVHARHRHSIVNGSIASAIRGDYGNVHGTNRTAGSELWINPLMSLAWAFELSAVAERNLYLPSLQGTETLHEVAAIIRGFRRNVAVRGRECIPV